MEKSKRPVPAVVPWARPFWDAAREERLMIQRCSYCNKYVFYPRLSCPHCFSRDLKWVEASGRGKIYSYTIVENNAPSGFIDDMPYVVAIIKLEEGVNMLTNIVDCEFGELRCDMPVEVTFDKSNEEFTLPKFRPVRS